MYYVSICALYMYIVQHGALPSAGSYKGRITCICIYYVYAYVCICIYYVYGVIVYTMYIYRSI